MYNNSGAKISHIAKSIAGILISIWVVASLILALVLDELWLFGFVIGGVGIYLSWLSCLFLAAFGELVENTYMIKKHLIGNSSESSITPQNTATDTNE